MLFQKRILVKKMQINVFNSRSNTSVIKIDSGLFVQKPHSSTNHIEANVEGDYNMNN